MPSIKEAAAEFPANQPVVAPGSPAPPGPGQRRRLPAAARARLCGLGGQPQRHRVEGDPRDKDPRSIPGRVQLMMAEPPPLERLTASDLFMLLWDDYGRPSLLDRDGCVRVEAVRRQLEPRLHLVPPVRRLVLIAAETTVRTHKARPQAGSGIFRFAAAQRAWCRHFPRQRSVNLVVANVPGPPIPLYLAGGRLKLTAVADGHGCPTWKCSPKASAGSWRPSRDWC